MMEMISEKVILLNITEGKKKERLDTYLTNSLENATRSRIQKLIKAECVLVNGMPAKSNYQISSGDEIRVTIPVAPRPAENIPEDIPLDIVYEDEDLLVVNKQPGIVVHPSIGHSTGTLVNALLFHIDKLSDYYGDSRPGIVHRLDKDTSGLLLIAKDEWVHAELAKQFARRKIDRKYWAVCWGLFDEEEGEVISNIARSKKDRKIFTVSQTEGKYAHTTFKVLDTYEFASLIQLKLMTGRTHQIRVHLNHIGHPIFGDHDYNGRRINYGLHLPKIRARVNNLLEIMPRQALHAKSIGFKHPRKKKFMRFDSELPEDMRKLIGSLTRKTT